MQPLKRQDVSEFLFSYRFYGTVSLCFVLLIRRRDTAAEAKQFGDFMLLTEHLNDE